MNKQAMKAVEKGSLGGFMKAHYPVRETNPMKDESRNLPRNKKRSEENKKKFEEVAKKMKISDHLKEAKRMERAGYGGSTEHEYHINKIYGWDRPNKKK